MLSEIMELKQMQIIEYNKKNYTHIEIKQQTSKYSVGQRKTLR